MRWPKRYRNSKSDVADSNADLTRIDYARTFIISVCSHLSDRCGVDRFAARFLTFSGMNRLSSSYQEECDA